jgi:hypothetical protein
MKSWLIASLAVAAGMLWSQPIHPGSLDRGVTTAVVAPGTVLTAALAVASARDIGDVNFVSLSPMILAINPDFTASTYAIVTSKTNVPAVTFYLKLKRSADQIPCAGTVTTLTGGTAIGGGSEVYLPIEVTGCAVSKAEGVIGIMGSSGAVHERPIVLTRSESPSLQSAVLASLGLAVFLVVVAGWIMRIHGHKLGDPIGNASWDFSSSWASNVTAFAAAFSFITQLSVFPAKPSIGSRSEYVFLATFCLALAALAPAVQRAAGSTIVTATDGDAAAISTQTHGLVGGFLLACMFTLWAAFLQMGTQLLVLKELSMAVSVSSTVIHVTFAVIVFCWVGLVIYGIRTMLATVAGNAVKSAPPTGSLKFTMFQNPSPLTRDVVNRKIPVL